MELTPFIFYAVICGGLALLSPVLGAAWIRFVVGAAVGVVAVVVLPIVRGLIGG